MTQAFARRTQTEIFRAGASGTAPRIPTRWPSLLAAAERAMSPEAWAYVHGSSGLESTADANAEAFARWRIVPRVLRDVSDRELGVTLFGHRYPTPLLASPVGVLELVDRDADLAIARAAASWGVPVILSNQASIPMERVAAEGGGGPRWFQLYWSSSDELVASLVARAEGIGVDALVVTLDTQLLGWRPRDLDQAYLPFIHGMGIAQYTSDPVFRRLVAERMAAAPAPGAPRPRVTPAALRTLIGMTRRYPGRFAANLRSGEPRVAVETFLDVFSRSDLNWEDLPALRSLTSLPIVLKGIQHPDDARRALDAGMDGLIVSNHAGRQLDGAIASLDALPGVVAAVDGRAPVLFDSGVRGGADVFRAMALGAAAVCVGRPWVYGMSIAGEGGAREALRNLIAEFDLTLALSGHRSVAELSSDALVRD
ncbi:alpha-hydroxy-acid oxidizing protein [Lysinimonas soli]|uniref:Alpha-hydroxy-acid oxidizing protein n=1 Tax=Lysinimonas soli TaxID=1074233 RepID=A0ABW0NM85_9MICO